MISEGSKLHSDLPFYAKSRNLYGLLQSGATPQFNSTGTVVVRLGIERD